MCVFCAFSVLVIVYFVYFCLFVYSFINLGDERTVAFSKKFLLSVLCIDYLFIIF